MKSSLTGKILVCPQCNESYPRSTPVCPKDGTILVLPASDVDAFVGKLIDQKYKVIERLGAGGMGIVYKAEHIFMGRTVVLKMLHRHLAEMGKEGEFLKRFQREARTASQIEHANAVTLYDFGVHENQPYIVMQFNRGVTLKALLAQEKRLEPLRAYDILRQVGDAVGAAHKLNIIHRDLKPENIMVTRDDEGVEHAQVLDFGLAKVMSELENVDNSMTKTGVVLGTPFYMAPEQAIGAALDARTEVYTLALIYYEMIAGGVPFKADTAMKIMMMHIKEKPPAFSTLNPPVVAPPGLEDVLTRALKKEPKNRYDTVAELMRAIKEVVTPKPAPSPSVTPEALAAPLASELEIVAEPNIAGAERRARRWSAAAIGSMLFLGTTMGFALNPLVTYFSPEEIARRTEELKRKKEAQDILKEAKAFVKEGNMKAAFYEYNRAIAINPNDVEVYIELGRHYTDALRYDQAVIVLEKAVRVEPQHELARFSLANAFFKAGRYDEAAREYKKVLEINPKNKSAKKNLAIAEDQRS